MDLIEARHLTKVYSAGARAQLAALEDLTLTIPRGDFVALTGASGCGKTTLLALLGALDRPTRGEVLFDGQDLANFSDVGLARVRRRIGFVFQSFALLPGLPVWENITYPLIPRGTPWAKRQLCARGLLERVGRGDWFHARPEQLSGGEQQRVAVARALAGAPEVLLADEPTSNLDAATAADLLKLLKELHAGGMTIVVATHDPGVTALATRVHELRQGRLVLME